jgi:hypothetical protein
MIDENFVGRAIAEQLGLGSHFIGEFTLPLALILVLIGRIGYRSAPRFSLTSPTSYWSWDAVRAHRRPYSGS